MSPLITHCAKVLPQTGLVPLIVLHLHLLHQPSNSSLPVSNLLAITARVSFPLLILFLDIFHLFPLLASSSNPESPLSKLPGPLDVLHSALIKGSLIRTHIFYHSASSSLSVHQPCSVISLNTCYIMNSCILQMGISAFSHGSYVILYQGSISHINKKGLSCFFFFQSTVCTLSQTCFSFSYVWVKKLSSFADCGSSEVFFIFSHRFVSTEPISPVLSRS